MTRPATTKDALVELEGVRKAFGDLVAVDDVGFVVAEGETYGLLGPNGAGKSTTISILCGLLEADAGSVTVAGRAMTPRATDAKRAIGYVPQELAIYPDLTARENLDVFARLYGLDGATRRSRIDEVLEVIGLTDRADDQTEEYSGGMKRRLNIGLGMLHHPQVLVLDEPTVGVDPQSRNAILDAVEALAGEGMSVLYTTHYMEEAERLCDRVGIIDHGRLEAEGTRRELVRMVGERDRLDVRGTGDLQAAAAAAGACAGVQRAEATSSGVTALVDDAGAVLPAVLGAIGDAGMAITGVEVVEPDLEAVFLHLTGRALRD